MKNLITTSLTILLISCSGYNLNAQDIIIFRNGEETKSKVLEVSTDQVKYKKWENQDGPTYSSLKSDIFMIKYQNGTKDIFADQSIKASENHAISDEDAKKIQAVNRLEEYIKSKIKGPVISFKDFRKTNGKFQDTFEGNEYVIYCDVDILFMLNGWKVGWDDFHVYQSKPDLSNSLDYLYSVITYYEKGTLITLNCVATMTETDNGYELGEFTIAKVKNHGKDFPPIIPSSEFGAQVNDVVIGNNGVSQNNSVKNQEDSYIDENSLPDITTSHLGHFFNELKGSSSFDKNKYTSTHQVKGQPSINRRLFYRDNGYFLGSANFGRNNNYTGDTLVVNSNDTLSLTIIIEGEKSSKNNKIKINGECRYVISFQIEDSNGKEFLNGSYEHNAKTGTPQIKSVEEFSSVIPIKITPENVKSFPMNQPLYLSFLVKEKDSKSAGIEGFVEFEVK